MLFEARPGFLSLTKVMICVGLVNVGYAYYQQVYNYGTPGRSFYGGIKFTW